ncbi:hypothetical protein BXZ70DRAFT_363097 [Cristinia sonorae]|uniref:Uncharacterized protein n=1 Tax=Cristinia sonorae TaxID=1940300 RepID=A0A8K0UKI9_9AGAR|nr:hypothetical protein BXZ70DRAFT_363097 [Cristinia sonorae]
MSDQSQRSLLGMVHFLGYTPTLTPTLLEIPEQPASSILVKLNVDVLLRIVTFVGAENKSELVSLACTSHVMHALTLPTLLSRVQLMHCYDVLSFCRSILSDPQKRGSFIRDIIIFLPACPMGSSHILRRWQCLYQPNQRPFFPTSLPRVRHPSLPTLLSDVLRVSVNLRTLFFPFFGEWLSACPSMASSVASLRNFHNLDVCYLGDESDNALLNLLCGRDELSITKLQIRYFKHKDDVKSPLKHLASTLNEVSFTQRCSISVKTGVRCAQVLELHLDVLPTDPATGLPTPINVLASMFPNVERLTCRKAKGMFKDYEWPQADLLRSGSQLAQRAGLWNKVDVVVGDLQSLYILAIDHPVSSMRITSFRFPASDKSYEAFRTILNDAQPEQLCLVLSGHRSKPPEVENPSKIVSLPRVTHLHVDTRFGDFRVDSWKSNLTVPIDDVTVPNLTHLFIHIHDSASQVDFTPRSSLPLAIASHCSPTLKYIVLGNWAGHLSCWEVLRSQDITSPQSFQLKQTSNPSASSWITTFRMPGIGMDPPSSARMGEGPFPVSTRTRLILSFERTERKRRPRSFERVDGVPKTRNSRGTANWIQRESFY